MIRRHALIPVIAVAGCAASAGDVADESPAMELETARECVSVRSIHSFDAVDDQHLYVKAAGNRHYLFTLDRGCYGLRSAYGIAIRDTMSRVCSNSFGEVVYRDTGRRLESCRIRNIESVASKDDAEGLVKDRKEAEQERKEGKSDESD